MNKRIKVIFGILIALVLFSSVNVFAESCTYSKGTRNIIAANGSEYEIEYKMTVTINMSGGKVNSAYDNKNSKSLTVDSGDKYGSSCPDAIYVNYKTGTVYPKAGGVFGAFDGRDKLSKEDIFSCEIPVYFGKPNNGEHTTDFKLLTSVKIDYNAKSRIISPYKVKFPGSTNQSYDLTMLKKATKADCSKIIKCRHTNRNECWLGDKLANQNYDENPYTTDAGGNIYGDDYLSDMGDYFGDMENPGTCDEILDGDAKALLVKVFNWIRILTPVILIVIGALDFAKAILAADDKQMAMATRNFVTRCIVAVLIFFVPLLVYYFLEIALTSANLVSGSGGICNFLR